MVEQTIRSVAKELSSLPFVEGIVLGGSRARGIHTEDSGSECYGLTEKLCNEVKQIVSKTHGI